MKRWPSIKGYELEYRAKLVELIYSTDPACFKWFCQQADNSLPGNAHAVAAARIKDEMGDLTDAGAAAVQSRAHALFAASTKEMDARYAPLVEP